MFTYPTIDPIALQLGPLPLRWYGLMYLVGFIAAGLLASYRNKKLNLGFTSQQIQDLVFYCAIGAIIGGRLGYVLFYQTGMIVSDPLSIFKTWQGGMSFHGGFLGVLAALFFARKKVKRSFFFLSDFSAPLVPIGLGAGRLGNFINGELWGRMTDVKWAFVYPDGSIRHASALYEFFLEGCILFIFLWFYSSTPRPAGKVSAIFLMSYGAFRLFAELFRTPDDHIGFLIGQATMGQLLSIPMLLLGLFLFLRPRKS